MSGQGRRFQRLRWKIWGRVTDRLDVCPANAYQRIILGDRAQPARIGAACREGVDRCGSCWCGKLRGEARTEVTP